MGSVAAQTFLDALLALDERIRGGTHVNTLRRVEEGEVRALLEAELPGLLRLEIAAVQLGGANSNVILQIVIRRIAGRDTLSLLNCLS